MESVPAKAKEHLKHETLNTCPTLNNIQSKNEM